MYLLFKKNSSSFKNAKNVKTDPAAEDKELQELKKKYANATWTAEDEKAFTERAALLVKQFDAFEPIPGMHINGTLTLGENLADLGGLSVAYEAFEQSRQGKPAAVSQDGFTPEQRFFLSYAETWRFKIREEALRARLLSDEHAPPRYRVLGPLANLPSFAAAFNCKAGDAMVRPSGDRPNN